VEVKIGAVVLAGLHSTSDGTAESKAVAAPVQDSHFAGMCSAVAVESCRMGSGGSHMCSVDMEAAAVAERFRTDSALPAVDMEAASSAEPFRMDLAHPVVGILESPSSAAAVAERFCMDLAMESSSSAAAVAARSASAEIAEPELVVAAGTDCRDLLVELGVGIPVRTSDGNSAEE